MSRIRVAVDVGGTFTDICIMDEDSGAIRIEKTASTPDDPMQAIMNGVEQGRIDLSQVTHVLSRHDGRHQCADHPPPATHRNGLHRGFP